MDTILRSNRILNRKNWLFFKLYRDPTVQSNWKGNLDWYHQTLMDVVRPVVTNQPVAVVFFGIYGPDAYNIEPENYVKQITPTPTNQLLHIKLRFCTKPGKKTVVKNSLITLLAQNTNLVWDYEVMRTFDVFRDLGTRYGSQNNTQTLKFTRYWDATCRYILSILVSPGNWVQDVDVWGTPHLVNNSLGSYLRLSQYTPNPIQCRTCGLLLYLETGVNQVTLGSSITLNTPSFLAICPNCNSVAVLNQNI